MTRKSRIGCLAVVAFWIACIAAVEMSGQGLCLGLAEFSTIQGGWLSKGDLALAHGLDCVTAPLQVAVLWPCAAVKYIYENSGERLRQKEALAAEERERKRYEAMLDENPTLFFSLPDFASPSNRAALAAFDDWIAKQWIYGKVDEERLEQYAEFAMAHREIMPYIESLWRAPKMRQETQIRGLQTAVGLAESQSVPQGEMKWLLENMMRTTSGNEWSPPIIPDDVIERYVNHPVKCVSECAREELRYREYRRNEKKRIDEYLRKAKSVPSSDNLKRE